MTPTALWALGIPAPDDDDWAWAVRGERTTGGAHDQRLEFPLWAPSDHHDGGRPTEFQQYRCGPALAYGVCDDDVGEFVAPPGQGFG